MQERLVEQVNLIAEKFSTLPIAIEFFNRAKEGNLTRDENPTSHFCVYFAAYDPDKKQIFIGHHKKSGLWLFNGGHIDKGEIPSEALVREMGEEWGTEISLQDIGEPRLITITPIKHPKIKCTSHYDIWYFVPVSRTDFTPDEEKLETEFYTTGWKSIDEARNIVTDKNTLVAMSEFEKLFNNKE